jgi:hypothetical protein
LTVIDPHDPGSLRGAGVTTGIWSLIIPIVAMFVGGLAAARVGGAMTRTAAAIQGGVLWSRATNASGFGRVWLVASQVGGGARVGAQAAAGMGDIASSMAPQALGNIEADDLLAPINQRLQAAGNPPVSADQMDHAVQLALQSTVRNGGLDREELIRVLSTTTALSPEQAREVTSSLQQRFEQTASRTAAQAETAALQAAESTGKGLIGMFFAMLLGLIAAVAGSVVGITRGQRAVAERVTERAERLAARHA